MNKDSLEIVDQEMVAFLTRNMNLLSDSNILTRKKAILQIYEKINEEKINIIGTTSQQFLINFHKAILKCFSDSIEKIRETSIKIMKELISRCEDMSPFLPYILSILSERVNCHDLEGILNLPEVMRPPPSQKPQMHVKIIEHSEEIRLELCDLISIILSCCTEEMIIKHLDDVTNILRALAMDPFYEVQKAACQNISLFTRNFRRILLHFSEILARSLLLPLVSKKSKVKIAAMEALGQVLQCGVFKYNANIMEILIGFRDPNSVPIKDFYEPSNKINYFALLINDAKVSVREMFIRTIGDWLINLEDRYDHYSRLIPYLLSGFFDSMDEIQSVAYEVIEECGVMLEKEREKEFLDQKQYGVESDWTLGGALINLPLPHPFKKRPQLGARIFVRSHVRKFFHALYKELKDWKMENREKAVNLLMLAIIYSEDYMTQFLYECIPALMELTIPKSKEDQRVSEKICKCFELLGRYCDFNSYLPIIKSSLFGDYSENYDYFKCSLKALNCLLFGSLEATIINKTMGNKINFINEVISIFNDPKIETAFASLNCFESIQVFETLLHYISERSIIDDILNIFSNNGRKIFSVILLFAYISIFEQAFKVISLIDGHFALEVGKKFEGFSLFDYLKNIAKKINLDFKMFFLKNTNDILVDSKSLSYNTMEWFKLISLSSSHIFLFDCKEEISNQFEIINTSFLNNANPDSCDCLMKLFFAFLKKLCDSPQEIKKENKQYLKYFSNLIDSFSLILEWLNNLETKPKESYLKVFFNNVYLFSILFFKNISQVFPEIFENFERSLSRFIISWMNLQKKYFKTKSLDLMTLYIEIFRSFSLWLSSSNSKKQFFYEEKNKKQDIFIIPYSIDVFFDEYESVNAPNPLLLKLIMENLLSLFKCFPFVSGELFKGEKNYYENYDSLLNKLVKHAIDSQDLECKEYLMKCLKELWIRTPLNFKILLQSADYNKQYSRIEMLQKIGNLL